MNDELCTETVGGCTSLGSLCIAPTSRRHSEIRVLYGFSEITLIKFVSNLKWRNVLELAVRSHPHQCHAAAHLLQSYVCKVAIWTHLFLFLCFFLSSEVEMSLWGQVRRGWRRWSTWFSCLMVIYHQDSSFSVRVPDVIEMQPRVQHNYCMSFSPERFVSSHHPSSPLLRVLSSRRSSSDRFHSHRYYLASIDFTSFIGCKQGKLSVPPNGIRFYRDHDHVLQGIHFSDVIGCQCDCQYGEVLLAASASLSSLPCFFLQTASMFSSAFVDAHVSHSYVVTFNTVLLKRRARSPSSSFCGHRWRCRVYAIGEPIDALSLTGDCGSYSLAGPSSARYLYLLCTTFVSPSLIFRPSSLLHALSCCSISFTSQALFVMKTTLTPKSERLSRSSLILTPKALEYLILLPYVWKFNISNVS